MTFLASSSDRTVRTAVDAHLRAGPSPLQPAQATFETRNGHYVLSEGALVAAADDSLVGAEFVGWLIESEGYATVLPVWQEGARAILVDAGANRQIVVTSATRSFRIDEAGRWTGSSQYHPGSAVAQASSLNLGIPPCPPPPPRLAGMSAAPAGHAPPEPLVTVGMPEPAPLPARIPALRTSVLPPPPPSVVTEMRPSTPPTGTRPSTLLGVETIRVGVDTIRDFSGAFGAEGPSTDRDPPPPSSARVPPPPPSMRRLSAPPRPLPYPSPPPRRSVPVASPPPVQSAPQPELWEDDVDPEERRITAPQSVPPPPPSFDAPSSERPSVEAQALAGKTTFGKTTMEGIPLVEITLEEDLAAASLDDDLPEEESTDDPLDHLETGNHRSAHARRIPSPPPTDPYGFSAPQ